jgi:predicted tellurium resistance membrane protein TerC
MSLDNVIGIAGAAKDSLGLVIFGLLFSIPIIIWGSRFVLTLMDRFPMVILFGAGLLGWIGGGMLVDDVVLKPYTESYGAVGHYGAAIVGAILVVTTGKLLVRRQRITTEPTAEAPIDLAKPTSSEEKAP